jgi:hypothetical protein
VARSSTNSFGYFVGKTKTKKLTLWRKVSVLFPSADEMIRKGRGKEKKGSKNVRHKRISVTEILFLSFLKQKGICRIYCLASFL